MQSLVPNNHFLVYSVHFYPGKSETSTCKSCLPHQLTINGHHLQLDTEMHYNFSLNINKARVLCSGEIKHGRSPGAALIKGWRKCARGECSDINAVGRLSHANTNEWSFRSAPPGSNSNYSFHCEAIIRREDEKAQTTKISQALPACGG
jgi:hypothetical protein